MHFKPNKSLPAQLLIILQCYRYSQQVIFFVSRLFRSAEESVIIDVTHFFRDDDNRLYSDALLVLTVW